MCLVRFFFWAKAMYKTIDPTVCQHRIMSPIPPSMVVECEDGEKSFADQLRDWVDGATKECTKAEATRFTDIRKKAEEHFGRKLDGTVWTEAKLSQKFQGQFTQKGQPKKYYVQLPDKKGEMTPRMLK